MCKQEVATHTGKSRKGLGGGGCISPSCRFFSISTNAIAMMLRVFTGKYYKPIIRKVFTKF